jgi:flagellar hook-associated protein 3 FlgL
MSATLGNIYNNVTFAMNLNATELSRLQEQASTGSKINRASDQPSLAYRVLGLDSQSRSYENFMDNISSSVSTMEISLSVIESAISSVAEAKTQMAQIIGGIYGQEGRNRTAEGINNILEQMVSLANTKHMNEYLFAGTNTSTAPYAVERTNGEITSVTYQGSLEDRQIQMAPGVEASAFYVGQDIFHSDDRSTPIFFGSTGAAAGSGTSSVTGILYLTVTHDGSNYKLSIDDGATETTVPGSGDISNIAVTNSAGQVLYVDARNISATGVDVVMVTGTHDVFNSLINIRDLLRNSRNLSDSQINDARNRAIAALEEVRGLLVEKSVSVGSKIGFLEKLKTTVEDIKFGTQDESSTIEQADLAQIAIDISRRELLYQMSLSVAGRLLSVSLLDFIV